MQFAGIDRFGRTATWFATFFLPAYFERYGLRWMNRKGFVSPSASIYHANLSFGRNGFIGDRVIIFQDRQGGFVKIGDLAGIYDDSIVETGLGGSLSIGADTHIQYRCHLSAYVSPIVIGSKVQIGPRCAFFPYDHGVWAGELICKQPLQTKGGIVVGDDVIMGGGVIVLDGVKIGRGALIGAGSVVADDIPEGAIAVGVPARVVRMR
jgi:acetyltransferase-like isoleucine patch superfamily enzyme